MLFNILTRGLVMANKCLILPLIYGPNAILTIVLKVTASTPKLLFIFGSSMSMVRLICICKSWEWAKISPLPWKFCGLSCQNLSIFGWIILSKVFNISLTTVLQTMSVYVLSEEWARFLSKPGAGNVISLRLRPCSVLDEKNLTFWVQQSHLHHY